MNRLLHIFNSLISVSLASLSVGLFDFLAYFGILHDISSKGSLALYMVFWDEMINMFEDWLKKGCYTTIDCVFAEKQKSFNINNTPEFNVPKDKEEYLIVSLKITIKGAAKYLQDIELKIFFPNWIDMNIKRSVFLEMVGRDCCIIKLKDIIAKGQQKDIELDEVISFSLIKNCDASGKTFTSTILVEKKSVMAKLCCEVDYNKFKLRG